MKAKFKVGEIVEVRDSHGKLRHEAAMIVWRRKADNEMIHNVTLDMLYATNSWIYTLDVDPEVESFERCLRRIPPKSLTWEQLSRSISGGVEA